jgi:methionine-rich copper-binding protein CopC
MEGFMIWRRTALAGSLAAGLILAALTGTAQAHTSYVLPNVFSTSNADKVTLEVSLTEDFFRPEIAVQSQDFHLIRPNGARDTYDNIASLQQMTVLENDLTEPGTYRFSTGARLGRTSSMVRVGAEWRPLERGQTPPAGAQTQTSQTETVAEVYVTKGAPTRSAVDAPSGRLRFHPITHPSEIYLADGFDFTVLFGGAPLANQELTLYRGGGSYDEPHFGQTVRSDALGRVHLNFAQPGIYLAMTRHRAAAPAGAETSQRSYTTSLTFEVSR